MGLAGLIVWLVIPALPLAMVLWIALSLRILFDAQGATSQGSGPVAAAIGVGLILLTIRLLIQRTRLPSSVWIVGAGISAWTVLAFVYQGFSLEASGEGVRELSVVAAFAMGFILATSGRISGSNLLQYVVVLTLIPAMFAIIQFASGTGLLVAGAVRSNSFFVHPNSAAPFFAVGLCAAIVLADMRKDARSWITASICGVALLTTGSLAGVAAGIAGLVCYAFVRPGRVGAKVVMGLLAFLATGAFAVSPIGRERIASQARFDPSLYASQAATDGADSSLGWRLYNWYDYLQLWREQPIFGFGLGRTSAGDSATGTLPHNEYVRYLVETGLVGLVLLLAGVGLVLRALRKIRLTVPSPDLRFTAAAATCCVAAFMANGLAANTLMYSSASYSFAVILGGTFGLAHYTRSPTDLVVGHDTRDPVRHHVPAATVRDRARWSPDNRLAR
ncbi:MAG: hypothetical protein CMH83_18650 [Nocardioides sp.]|nr:hypothetical protein [Nocardioides sp.]